MMALCISVTNYFRFSLLIIITILISSSFPGTHSYGYVLSTNSNSNSKHERGGDSSSGTQGNFLPFGVKEGDLKKDIQASVLLTPPYDEDCDATNTKDCYNGSGGVHSWSFEERSGKDVYIGNRNAVLKKSIEVTPAGPNVDADTVIPLRMDGFQIVSGTFYHRAVINSSLVRDLIRRTTKDLGFKPDWSLVLTWVNTTWGLTLDHDITEPGTNSFQVTLSSDWQRNTTYVLVAYGNLEGVFHDRAWASIHFGDEPFLIPGSQTEHFHNQTTSCSNVAVPGLWVVRADERGRTVVFHNADSSASPGSSNRNNMGAKMRCSPAEDEYQFCPDETFSIDLTCAVEKVPGSLLPAPSVALHGLPRGTTKPTSWTRTKSSDVFRFSFYPEHPGRRKITFVARSSLDSSLLAEVTDSINVVVPPHSPILTANSLVIDNDDVVTTRLGETLHVTCDVASSGTGSAHLSLACPEPAESSDSGQVVPPAPTTSQSQEQYEASSSSSSSSSSGGNTSVEGVLTHVSFLVTQGLHGSSCVCHLNGCYSESTRFFIHVA